MKKEITKVLRSLAVPPHILGYEYLRTAIELCIEDSTLIHKVTKELYPQVAKLYQTTSSRVERAIRHAIEISQQNARIDEMNKYFISSLNHVTNSEYIAAIVDAFKLDMEG